VQVCFAFLSNKFLCWVCLIKASTYVILDSYWTYNFRFPSKRARKKNSKICTVPRGSWFSTNSKISHQLAYSFAERNCIPHRFNRDIRVAEYDWLQLFLKYHCERTVRKAKGLSIACGLGICSQEVVKSFTNFQEKFPSKPQKDPQYGQMWSASE
jgi:hypothetical protein